MIRPRRHVKTAERMDKRAMRRAFRENCARWSERKAPCSFFVCAHVSKNPREICSIYLRERIDASRGCRYASGYRWRLQPDWRRMPRVRVGKRDSLVFRYSREHRRSLRLMFFVKIEISSELPHVEHTREISAWQGIQLETWRICY